MAKSDRRRLSHDKKTKSRTDWVSIWSPPMPSLDVCVLNIDHFDCSCVFHFGLIQSHRSPTAKKIKFFASFWWSLHGVVRWGRPHKWHHRPLQWRSRSIHPIRVKSQPLKQRRLCHRNRRGTISVTRKKFKALVWRRNSSRRAIIHYGTSCATTASADLISILRQFGTVISLLENNEYITTKEEQDNIFFRP